MVFKGLKLKLNTWNLLKGDSRWGRMLFEVEDTTLEDISTPMLSIYQLNGKSIIDIECFILNNIDESVLFESSLESIAESVLSVINDSDIVVSGSGYSYYSRDISETVYDTPNVSSDFVDDFYYDDEDEYDDEYIDSEVSLDVSIQDIDSEYDFYDDVDYEDYDEDDDF